MQLFLCGYGFSVIWLESISKRFFCYVPTHFVKYIKNKCQCLINQYICPSISSSSKLALCMPYHFAVILLCMFCALLSGNAGSSSYTEHEIDLLYRNQSHSGNCKLNQ